MICVKIVCVAIWLCALLQLHVGFVMISVVVVAVHVVFGTTTHKWY
jgi:hypothetical protein